MANGAVGDNPAPAVLREFQPDDTLLRALTKKIWLGDLHDAFMLRPNETGLSVCFDCTPQDCRAVMDFNCVYGVTSLAVSGVTLLELTVRADQPNHALIEGIPNKEIDAVGAEWCASRLAAIATIVDRTRRDRP